MTSSQRDRQCCQYRRRRSSDSKEFCDDTFSPSTETSKSNGLLNGSEIFDCLSPPSYSVIEGTDGRLINPGLNVTWPERPTAGRYSLIEYHKRRSTTKLEKQVSARDTQEDINNDTANKDDNAWKSYSHKQEPDECCEVDEFTERSQRINFVEAQVRERKFHNKEEKHHEEERRKMAKKDWLSLEELKHLTAAHHCHIGKGTNYSQHIQRTVVPNYGSGASPSFSQSSSAVTSKSERGTSLLVPQSLSKHFIGVMPATKVERFLRSTQFVLYYHRSQIQFLDDVPLDLPLKIAYMTNRGKVHHYTLNAENRFNNQRLWQVILDGEDDNAEKQPCFLSLDSLVSYYETFVNLRNNNEVEVFPISEPTE